MDDAANGRAALESPCVQVCLLHPETGLCIGCARSGAEIAAWSSMSVRDRRIVMEALPARAAVPTSRRGGRSRKSR